MFLSHTSPYVFFYGKINKCKDLENTEQLTPTGRLQEKNQNKATVCLIK